jgi:hypothetical protein
MAAEEMTTMSDEESDLMLTGSTDDALFSTDSGRRNGGGRGCSPDGSIRKKKTRVRLFFVVFETFFLFNYLINKNRIKIKIFKVFKQLLW